MAEKQRLDKLLANFGFGSRRELKQTAKQGIITVDGKVVKDCSVHVDPQNSEIAVNGKVLNYREFIYVMMNKPSGVVSATWDGKYKTVIDILPEEFKCFDLFPVGRLDIDTEGLLLLTNDGHLAHELLSPKKHVPKKYYALVEGFVTENDILEFEKGVTLEDDYTTMPAELFIIKSDQISEIELVIHEGKFHQVKRMFEAVNKEVKYLKRVQMGSLLLDEALEIGNSRELKAYEIEKLKDKEQENE